MTLPRRVRAACLLVAAALLPPLLLTAAPALAQQADACTGPSPTSPPTSPPATPTAVLDRVPPTISDVRPADGTLHRQTVLLDAKVTDEGSGVCRVELLVDGTPVRTDDRGGGQYGGVWDGGQTDAEHALVVRAVDRNGNAAESTVRFRADGVLPRVTLPPVVGTEGEVEVAFSEPVGGLQGGAVAGLQLVEAVGFQVPVQGSVLCGEEPPFTCGQAERSALLSTSEPLALGQLYTVDGPSVRDAAGNPLDLTGTLTRTPSEGQEDDPNIFTTWGRSGSGAAVARLPGSSAFTITEGRRLRLVAGVGPTRGQALVLVDGEPLRTVDLYAAAPAARAVLDLSNLSDDLHLVEVRVLGRKGPRSRDALVELVEVQSGPSLQDRQRSEELFLTWRPHGTRSVPSGAVAQADVRGALLEAEFGGAGADLHYLAGPDQGVFEVVVDDRPPVLVNAWSPRVEARRVALRGYARDSSHLLTVEVLGTKDRRSRGTTVTVDRVVARY